MATETGSATDRGVGLAFVLGAVATIGAILMFIGAPDLTAAWGFATAMVFSVLAVVGIHLYWE